MLKINRKTRVAEILNLLKSGRLHQYAILLALGKDVNYYGCLSTKLKEMEAYNLITHKREGRRIYYKITKSGEFMRDIFEKMEKKK